MPRFFQRRERWTLTWTGRLLLLAALTTTGLLIGRELCPFLSVTSPARGEYLVVESWMPAFAFREAVSIFRNGGYRKIIAAGVYDYDWDEPGGLTECFGDKSLARFGAPPDRIVLASAGKVQRDRTFHAAMAVKAWLQQQGVRTTSIDVVSIGPHARRSQLLFQQALGEDIAVGIISVPDRRYDPSHWWRSSAGVRMVIGEAIAYVYAKTFFSHEPDA